MAHDGAPASPDRPVPHVRVGGVDAAAISLVDLIGLMLEDAPARRRSGLAPRLVFDVNGHAISLHARSAEYRAAMEQADLIHADGQVIVAASRLFRETPVPDRSATTDLFLDSLIPAAERQVRYFLLGATEDVNAGCAARVRQIAPGLQVVGRRNGFFRGEEEETIAAINASGADVLWVGLGKPLEQVFSARYRDRLDVGWIVTCGGLFNYVTGNYRRAPLWMQRHGLEWLHRMLTNPGQLAWRYITTNPHALWRIWKLRHESSGSTPPRG